MKFNEYYGILGKEYVDVLLETDILLFLDPNKINKVKTDMFDKETARCRVMSYFLYVNQHYKEGKKDLAFSLINCSSEINSTRLGYSKGKPFGKGASAEILDKFFSKFQKLADLDDSILRQPWLIPLFVENFGADRFSDLITNIICKELSEFTFNVCVKYGIQEQTKEFKLQGFYNIETQKWETISVRLPYDSEGKPILLVPKEMTVSEYDFTVQEYVGQVILVQKQMEHLDKRSPLVTMKWVKSRDKFVAIPPSKKKLKEVEIRREYPIKGGMKRYALDESLKQPHLLTQYINFVENR